MQYRPFEIDILLKSLADLKIALNLTSSERELYQIVEYSQSEEIFRNNKENEGVEICQSNIGNLESQLLKFDKAIYHLALSLQDNRLQIFLGKNIFDELDEGDTLLNQLYNVFNQKEKEKKNILIKKKLDSSKDNYSKKLIGILINTRYVRLIQFNLYI